MKCARLNLQERVKPSAKPQTPADKPRRYCQKRMINPDHSEDPRWNDVHQRFYCNPEVNSEEEKPSSEGLFSQQEEDLFLTVQNLKFQGDTQERKRPRTSFKYKSLTGTRSHRMFIKQVVDDESTFDDDRSSQLTSYYLDDYIKYIVNNDRSRPCSSKSSAYQKNVNNNLKEKSTQVETKEGTEIKKNVRKNTKMKNFHNKIVKYDIRDEVDDIENVGDANIDHANFAYHKSGKRKSLTISRAPSPETIQVIRVDVVCNYSSNSTTSDCDEKIKHTTDNTKLSDKDLQQIKLTGSHFADKYLLTNTIKSVDESLSCGSKVTLLCKTFKLSNRGKSNERKHFKNGKNSQRKNKVSPERLKKEE